MRSPHHSRTGTKSLEDLFDPTGTLLVEDHQPASGLSTLRGKRLGLLDNTKSNADRFLALVATELHEQYGIAEWRIVRKDSQSAPAPTALLYDLIRDSDFVVTGIGD